MENKQFQSPVYHVIAVPYEKIIPNTYNPNKVAPPEMKLLYESIKADGFTMPISFATMQKQGYVCYCGRLPQV